MLPIRLFSPFVGGIFLSMTDWDLFPGQATVLTGNPFDQSFCELFTVAHIPKLLPHFPYGWPVEPD
jgi:hypothetical protein